MTDQGRRRIGIEDGATRTEPPLSNRESPSLIVHPRTHARQNEPNLTISGVNLPAWFTVLIFNESTAGKVGFFRRGRDFDSE